MALENLLIQYLSVVTRPPLMISCVPSSEGNTALHCLYRGRSSVQLPAMHFLCILQIKRWTSNSPVIVLQETTTFNIKMSSLKMTCYITFPLARTSTSCCCSPHEFLTNVWILQKWNFFKKKVKSDCCNRMNHPWNPTVQNLFWYVQRIKKNIYTSIFM